MPETRRFLVEIGTEELPPKALRELSEAFGAGLRQGLDDAALGFDQLACYATPRRLAVRVDGLAVTQPDRQVDRRGPPVSVAVDDAGHPTKAGLKFAASCDTPFERIGRISTDKGDYLHHTLSVPGAAAETLLPGLVADAVTALPIPRRMRWGSTDYEFVRPVHWLVMLLDDVIVPATLFGVQAGRQTHGHRFHCPRPLSLGSAAEYPDVLERDAYVIADFNARRRVVATVVDALAKGMGGRALYDTALIDEVTALVEWPVAIHGGFEDRFLELPREVLISTLQSHQRYFPVAAPDGALLPRFVAVSNLESRDPGRVTDGNERVVRPRLSDAAFFWDTDRAATLAKCDLVTAMVGEFPDLQGTMGRYYAAHDGEPEAVAAAIGEQYLPRFAGDALPATDAGRVVALADKLDTLCGIFAIGQRPTGTKDPFGLRRAALGALRILIEHRLDIDLAVLLRRAAARLPGVADPARTAADVFDYVMERLRAYYTDGAAAFVASVEMFEAVYARHPVSPLDFHRRLDAVRSFTHLPAADSLAAANKRVTNILRQAGQDDVRQVNPERLVEAEERILFQRIETLRGAVEPLLERREYRAALECLATLREPVDAFFDTVMVMSDDDALRANRLALLSQMRELFLHTADLSRLSG
jgi:glycyl-tRNA synthetase beta chain